MKVAFIYGAANFYKGKDGLYYSGGTVNLDIWKRYLTIFEEIIALGKNMASIPNNVDLSLISMENVEIRVMTPLNGFKSLLTQFEEVKRECYRCLEDSDCAIIRLPSIEGVIACNIARKLNKPYLVEVVGCAKDSLKYHGSLKGKISALPIGLMNRKAIKEAPYAIYVTENYLQSKYPCEGVQYACSDVNLTLDNEIFEKRKLKIHAKKNKSSFKIGMVGSLDVYYKGHITALKSLKILKDRNFNVELHLIGAGQWKSIEGTAKKLGVDELVFFNGLIPSGKEVINWLDELDVFIMPSLTEGLPRSLVEAMSRAIPCIASNVGGIPELLDKNFLHEPKDYVDLSNKIIKLIDDKSFYLKTAEHNLFVSKKYERVLLDEKRNYILTKFKDFCIEKENVI